MRRTLIFSVGLLGAAACGERAAVVEAPLTPAAVWVAPDMAFALPLPEGWMISSSDAHVTLPAYGADIHAASGGHLSEGRAACRLVIVDFRRFDDFLLDEDPDLPGEEVDDLVRIQIEAVEEYVWPRDAYRESIVEYFEECDCQDWALVGRPESIRLSYPSDQEARALWRVQIKAPGNEATHAFFAGERSMNEYMFKDIKCGYWSYADRANHGASDLAALRAAMEF